MLQHLSKIIGQPEDNSHEVKAVREELLSSIKRTVAPVVALDLECSISVEECFQDLQALGKEKSPGWDGLTVEFFKEFWEDLKSLITKIANNAFLKEMLDTDIKRGLIKPIPKMVCCSELKHWRPISMMKVAYKILAKVIISLKIVPDT